MLICRKSTHTHTIDCRSSAHSFNVPQGVFVCTIAVCVCLSVRLLARISLYACAVYACDGVLSSASARQPCVHGVRILYCERMERAGSRSRCKRVLNELLGSG